MGFWKNVERERIYQGLTRKELAFRANIAYQGIGLGIERDSMPGADTALKVARVLGVPLEFLLEGADLATNSSASSDSALKNQAGLYQKHRDIIDAFERIPPNVRIPIHDMIVRIGASDA